MLKIAGSDIWATAKLLRKKKVASIEFAAVASFNLGRGSKQGDPLSPF